MPNRTIYLSKEGEALIEEIKDLTTDSVSNVIFKALSKYLYDLKVNKQTNNVNVANELDSLDQGNRIFDWEDKNFRSKVYSSDHKHFTVFMEQLIRDRANLRQISTPGEINLNQKKCWVLKTKNIEELVGVIPNELLNKIKEYQLRQ